MHSDSVRKNAKKKWGVVNGRSCPILPDVSLERNNEPILPATRNLSHVRVLHCVRRGATARSRRPPASLIMGVPKTKVRALACFARLSRPRIVPVAPAFPPRLPRFPIADTPIPSTRPTQWSHEEEEALRKGVKKYGAGKWRFIQKDPVLGKILNQRSNVDLKVSARATAATRPFPTADGRPPEVGGVPCHRDTARPPDFSPRRRPNPASLPIAGQVEKHVSRPQHRGSQPRLGEIAPRQHPRRRGDFISPLGSHPFGLDWR